MLTGSIAFYCRSLCFGGIERNIIRIIQDCKSSGIRTILITSKNTPISKVIPNGGIEIITTKTEGKRLGLRSIWQLAKILDEKETKALIITKPIEIFTGALIKIISGFKIKIIYYQHVGLNFKNGWFLYSLLFKWVDKWITPVNYIRKQALEQRWSRKKNIHVITFNINLEPFLNSLVTKEQARLDLDIPLNKKMIGILGRPGSGKNQDFLIRAVNFLKLNNYTLDLLIMGEPKSQEEKVYSGFLRELMCECNLQDRIHFRTFSEDKISFFRTIDIFVNTITGETCDITMIESMAAGVPVISVQSDYNSEILEDGTLGILYKENDLEDFSAKIIKVLNQNKLYTYLQKEGIRTAGEKYNLKSKSSEFNEFIYGVLNFK